MYPFALDPTVVLGNLDAQTPRPAAPKSGGPNSFDNHLQQAAQAGSSTTGPNPTDANPTDNGPQGSSPTPASSGANPSKTQAPPQSGADQAKKPASARATDGKSDQSRPHSPGDGAAKPDTKDGSTTAASTAATDSAAAKSAAASSDTEAAPKVSPPDATNPQSGGSAKSDQLNASQPVLPVEIKAAVDPTPSPPNAKGDSSTTADAAPTTIAKSATPTVSPALAAVAQETLSKTTGSKLGGKTTPGSAKAGATSKGQHPRSADNAKSHQAGSDFSQSAGHQSDVASATASAKPGDPTLAEPAVSPEQSPAEQIADQINNSNAVIPVSVSQSPVTPAVSTASVPATVQAATQAIEASQTAPNTSDAPAAGPAPAVSSLVAQPTSNATIQQGSAGSTTTSSGPGAGGAGGVENARFVQRVAKAFQTTGDQGGSLRLRLSPPDLGSLKLNVTVTDGVLNARVQAETSQARDMLLENLPALRERLAEHNIKIDQFDVELFDGSTGGSSDQPHGNSDSQQAYLPAAPRNSVKSAATTTGGQAAAAASPTRRVTAGSLDVVI